MPECDAAVNDHSKSPSRLILLAATLSIVYERRTTLVNFWMHENSKKWDSTADAQGFQRGSLPFLEHKNGDPITPSEQRAIMKLFRAVWFGLRQRGIALISWGRAILDARNALHEGVSRIHPELAHCDRYWKIKHIARDRSVNNEYKLT